MWVVPILDEFEQRHLRFGSSAKRTPRDEFGFDGSEEYLGHGVVVAVTGGEGRRTYPHLPTAVAERERGVMRAPKGVMDHRLGPAPAPADRNVERFEDQFGAKMAHHRPSHDVAAEHIEDYGQEHELCPDGYVGDFGHPEPVGSLGTEGSFDQVPRCPSARLRARASPTAHPGRSLEALATHRPPLGHKLGMNPRRTMEPSRRFVNHPCFAAQPVILLSTTRTPTAPPPGWPGPPIAALALTSSRTPRCAL